MADIKSGKIGADGSNGLSKVLGIAGGIVTGDPAMIAGSLAQGTPAGGLASFANNAKGAIGPDQPDNKGNIGNTAIGRAVDTGNNHPAAQIANGLEILKNPDVLPPDLAMASVDHMLRAKHGHYLGMDTDQGNGGGDLAAQ